MSTFGLHCQNNDQCYFSVWAPLHYRMVLHLVYPEEKKIEMKKDAHGYFHTLVKNAKEGYRYFYMPEGMNDYPDPRSHYQPEGVHGPSEIVNHQGFRWNDDRWHGIPFQELILYELHVGTFTEEGTFTAIIPRLDELIETGINALELLPVGQFPGDRNWGYDGVFPYAVQHSYGGPTGLKKLVEACHQKGIAVFLDVVYNHLGPEGNYLSHFGPYFTNAYRTPWGEAINYDGEWTDGVRDYFSNNPLYWFELYHIDGLRVDAIHMVFDNSAVNLWELIENKITLLKQTIGRTLYMIAESDLNNPRVMKAPALGGLGFDAQWLDDFHHALYVLLDKKGQERYEDFGRLEQLVKAYQDGYVHTGEWVKFRKRKFGTSSAGVPGDKFIVFNQNHDQIGNRVRGDRLCSIVDFERLKIAAAAILLSPYIPMLFMGEEYADNVPFYYFVSHSDKKLIEAVREGRKKEFENFHWDIEPPDPQDENTFIQSKLQWLKRFEGSHRIILQWHKHLIRLRKNHKVFSNFNKRDLRVTVVEGSGLCLHRRSNDNTQLLLCIFNLSEQEIKFTFPSSHQPWRKILDSKESQWMENNDPGKTSIPEHINGGLHVDLPALGVSVFETEEIVSSVMLN